MTEGNSLACLKNITNYFRSTPYKMMLTLNICFHLFPLLAFKPVRVSNSPNWTTTMLLLERKELQTKKQTKKQTKNLLDLPFMYQYSLEVDLKAGRWKEGLQDVKCDKSLLI